MLVPKPKCIVLIDTVTRFSKLNKQKGLYGFINFLK